MKVKVLSDKPVSPNLASRNTAIACAYPQSVALDSGEIVCLYRQGASKHSYDGVLVLQSSFDHGVSWSDPVIAFDGRGLPPPQSIVSGGLCQTPSGDLLITFGLVDASQTDVYVFSDEGMAFERQVCATCSSDGGASWSNPTTIDTAPFPRAGITARPLILPGGEIFVPVEVELPSGAQGTAATFTSDNGCTFEPQITCAADPTG